MAEKLPLSVSIISFNEENNIGRTLESLAGIASEIIVVDSHSSDRTCEIAASFGAKIFVEDWKGHIAQKNSALEKCTQEWILMLDCDEVISPLLLTSIIEAINHPVSDGYLINRRTHYLGKLLKHSWQPDWNLRLVKKSSMPEWGGLNTHDELKIIDTSSKIHGDLIHYSYKNLNHHLTKTVEYSPSSAKSYYQTGKKFSILKLLLNPVISFIKLYFINLGILDGIHGLIAGFSAYIYTFMKYLFLWELERENIK